MDGKKIFSVLISLHGQLRFDTIQRVNNYYLITHN